jgi:hypothetical protein
MENSYCRSGAGGFIPWFSFAVNTLDHVKLELQVDVLKVDTRLRSSKWKVPNIMNISHVIAVGIHPSGGLAGEFMGCEGEMANQVGERAIPSAHCTNHSSQHNKVPRFARSAKVPRK